MKRFRWRPGIALADLALILLLGYLGYRSFPQVRAALGAGAAHGEAPAFALQTLEGEPVSLESLRGKVVLVNFWATWCPPCRWEMPGFQRVYEDRRADGLVVLGVSTDRTGERGVRDFLRERGITYPVAMATDRLRLDFGGVRALPTSFLIDRQGRIRQRVQGVFTEPALRLAVDHLLEEPAPARSR